MPNANKLDTTAHPRVSRDVGGVVGDSLGDAKVDKLQGALHEDEVRRLQITVNHLGQGGGREGNGIQWRVKVHSHA